MVKCAVLVGKAPHKVVMPVSLPRLHTHTGEAGAIGAVPGFQRSPTTFVAYLIAHEAYHRGHVIVALRMSGHKLSHEEVYGLWEWGEI